MCALTPVNWIFCHSEHWFTGWIPAFYLFEKPDQLTFMYPAANTMLQQASRIVSDCKPGIGSEPGPGNGRQSLL
jgi:hypothetical protein